MSRRVFAATSAVAIMTAVLLLVLARGTGPTSFLSFVAIAEAAGGQGAQASSSDAKSRVGAKPWTPPRTPWGHPDLQGVWDYRTITPLERPSALSGKQFLTDEEAAIFEREENRRQNRDLIDPAKGGLQYPPGGVVPYNNNVQIIQTAGYVAILNEMIHEHRIVPLDGRPHLAQNIRQWLGDSRGHWEGDTLVVDTTNFSPKFDFRGAGPSLHVVER